MPLFKWLKASPVIGFLSAGLLMGPAGLHLFSDLNDMESLADFGVLFLLFEQGLELTVDRLKSLSKFAFGMGTLQVALCTAAFFTFPFVGGVQFLEFFMGSAASVVDITRVDEALVIGAALSLSSSAFVLKILQEKGQLATRFGAACLGILLLQDIAVVPLLVLLPIIETSGPMPLSAQAALLGATFLKALLGLGGILVIGGAFVRFLFSLVAKTRSSETFVALCLLVALGTGIVLHFIYCHIIMNEEIDRFVDSLHQPHSHSQPLLITIYNRCSHRCVGTIEHPRGIHRWDPSCRIELPHSDRGGYQALQRVAARSVLPHNRSVCGAVGAAARVADSAGPHSWSHSIQSYHHHHSRTLLRSIQIR